MVNWVIPPPPPKSAEWKRIQAAYERKEQAIAEARDKRAGTWLNA